MNTTDIKRLWQESNRFRGIASIILGIPVFLVLYDIASLFPKSSANTIWAIACCLAAFFVIPSLLAKKYKIKMKFFIDEETDKICNFKFRLDSTIIVFIIAYLTFSGAIEEGVESLFNITNMSTSMGMFWCTYPVYFTVLLLFTIHDAPAIFKTYWLYYAKYAEPTEYSSRNAITSQHDMQFDPNNQSFPFNIGNSSYHRH